MQQAQVLTYALDGVIAERLRELAQARRFWLRETSQLSACQNLAWAMPPCVLVLVLGRELEKELTFLTQVHECLPQTPTIVLGETDNPILAGLAWDLGATFALFPPMPGDVVVELVSRMLPAMK